MSDDKEKKPEVPVTWPGFIKHIWDTNEKVALVAVGAVAAARVLTDPQGQEIVKETVTTLKNAKDEVVEFWKGTKPTREKLQREMVTTVFLLKIILISVGMIECITSVLTDNMLTKAIIFAPLYLGLAITLLIIWGRRALRIIQLGATIGLVDEVSKVELSFSLGAIVRTIGTVGKGSLNSGLHFLHESLRYILQVLFWFGVGHLLFVFVPFSNVPALAIGAYPVIGLWLFGDKGWSHERRANWKVWQYFQWVPAFVVLDVVLFAIMPDIYRIIIGQAVKVVYSGHVTPLPDMDTMYYVGAWRAFSVWATGIFHRTPEWPYFLTGLTWFFRGIVLWIVWLQHRMIITMINRNTKSAEAAAGGTKNPGPAAIVASGLYKKSAALHFEPIINAVAVIMIIAAIVGAAWFVNNQVYVAHRDHAARVAVVAPMQR